MKEDKFKSPIDALGSMDSFAELDRSALVQLQDGAVERSYGIGEAVFREGEACAGFVIVVSGWLKASKVAPNGREQVLRFVGPGEALNEAGAIAGMPNQATVYALEPATVWIISHEMLDRLMREDSEVLMHITRNLANRVVHLMNLVEDLSLRSVVSRLARMLLEHSGGNQSARHRRSTQEEMAARIGTVPDVLSRALRSLASEGLIDVDRRSLKILDPVGLAKKADMPK